MFLKKTKELLEEKGISKNKMLTDLGLAKNSFVNWQERNTVPNGETLAKIAKYFDVPIEYLLGKESYKQWITIEELHSARKKVAEIIEANDINIQDFENKLGTNYATINCWLSGQSDFFNEKIDKLADYFNVSTDYLLGREKDTASVTDAGLKQIMDSYATLNTAGKAKAVDYMKDLANNPNYNDTQVVKIVPKSTAQIAAYGGGVKTIETELSEEEILKILEDYDKSIGGEK